MEYERILSPNDEQLVTDLAADYSERMVAGTSVSIQEYLDKLPNEQTRKAFKTLANMSRFVESISSIQDTAAPESDTSIIKSMTASRGI